MDVRHVPRTLAREDGTPANGVGRVGPMSHGVYFSVRRGTVSRVQRDAACPHGVRGVYRYSTRSSLPDLEHIGGVRDRFLDAAIVAPRFAVLVERLNVSCSRSATAQEARDFGKGLTSHICL